MLKLVINLKERHGTLGKKDSTEEDGKISSKDGDRDKLKQDNGNRPGGQSVLHSAIESLGGELMISTLQSQKMKTEQWLSLGKTRGVARKQMLSCYTREISCEKCLNNK